MARTLPAQKVKETGQRGFKGVDNQRSLIEIDCQEKVGGPLVDGRIFVGDDRRNEKYFPAAALLRWNDEERLDVRIPDFPDTATTEIRNNKLIFTDSNRRAEIFMDDQNRMEIGQYFYTPSALAGGFEYVVEGHDNFSWLKQPDVSNEQDAQIALKENRDGEMEEHWRYLVDGEFHWRPVRMNGGYVLKHKTKVNHERGGIDYRCGWAYTFEAAYYEDATGDRVWVEPTYSPSRGVVIIPPPPGAWRGRATYPVFLGPILGLDDITGTSFFQSTRKWFWQVLSSEASSSIDSLHVYRGPGGSAVDVQVTLYDNDATPTPDEPNNQFDATITFTSNENSWQSGAYTGSDNFSASQYLWIAHQFDGNHDTAYINSSSPRGSLDSTYGSWPDPFTSFTTTNTQDLASYITYTAAAGGGTILPFMVAMH